MDLLKTISPTPISRLSFDKSPNGTKIAFMPKEVGLLSAVRPEIDGVGQRLHRLLVSTDERPAKIYVFELVLLRLKVGDLSDIVAGALSAWKLQKTR